MRHGEDQPRARTLLPTEAVSPLFEAALEATEEAVYNALLRPRRDRQRPHGRGDPHRPVRAALAKYGRGAAQGSAAER